MRRNFAISTKAHFRKPVIRARAKLGGPKFEFIIENRVLGKTQKTMSPSDGVGVEAESLGLQNDPLGNVAPHGCGNPGRV
jgi:hypothetical protein